MKNDNNSFWTAITIGFVFLVLSVVMFVSTLIDFVGLNALIGSVSLCVGVLFVSVAVIIEKMKLGG